MRTVWVDKHVRHRLQPVEHQVPHGRRIAGADQQHEVVLARDERRVPDLGDLRDALPHRFPGMLADLDVHVRRDAVAAALWIDDGGVSHDHTGPLEPLDPGIHPGPGDVQASGERPHGKPAVRAQGAHDPPVGLVERCRMSRIIGPGGRGEIHIARN